MPKCRAIQALCNLAQKGLILLVNLVPQRTTCPANTISLGADGGDDLSSITGATCLMLCAPYGDAVDVFRPKKASLAAVYEGRPRAMLLVNERMRRAVLEPHEPVTYQMSSSGSTLTHSISLNTHQALAETYHGKGVK